MLDKNKSTLRIFPTLSALVLMLISVAPCMASSIDLTQSRSISLGPSLGRITVNVTPDEKIRQNNITIQAFDYSCGSAALTTLLNQQFALGFTEEAVIDGLLVHGEVEKIKQGRRFSLLDMKKYLASIGFASNGYSAGIDDLEDIPTPAIISIEIKGFRHFVVYQGVVNDHVILADPAYGNMSVSRSKFKSLWTQRVFFTVLSPIDESSGGRSIFSSRKNTLSEQQLRFVSEDSYYNSVLRGSNLQQRQLTQQSQTRSLHAAGLLNPSVVRVLQGNGTLRTDTR